MTIHSCGDSAIFVDDVRIHYGVKYKNSLAAALILDSIFTVSIFNVSIQNNVGYGLLAVNLLGLSIIDSSTFLENNMQTEQSNTMGGNVFIFYAELHHHYGTSDNGAVNLTINNSHFLNGSANSKTDCNHNVGDFCANGLGFVITQTTIDINFCLENTFFYGNSKNLLHPSLSIVDYTKSVVSIVISNCTFNHDGVLKIQEFSKFPTAAHLIKVENCRFRQGVGTGIDIYIADNSFLLDIVIDGCIFDYFSLPDHSTYKSQVVSVRYVPQQTIRLEIGCPHIKVKISTSVFRNNHIPASRFMLTDKHRYEDCPSVILSNCTYSNNHSPNDHIVQVYSEGTVTIWKYEQELYRKFSQVEIINTTFIDNSLTKDSYKGILGLKDVLASFSNCDFLNSKGSALQAIDSVVCLLNTNYFMNNTGKEGGGLSLIRSRLYINENSTTILSNNTADYGGGLFATPLYFSWHDKPAPYYPMCTLGVAEYNATVQNITVYFGYNTAQYGDSVFYGAFSHCYVSTDCSKHDCNDFTFANASLLSLFTFSSRSAFEFSTIPTNLLICETDGSSHNNATVHIYPGANFNISYRVVGEYQMIAPVVLTAKLCNDYNQTVCMNDYQSEYPYGADQQLATYECSNITYKVHSLQKKVYLDVKINRLQGERSSVTYYDGKDISVVAEINILPCPLGYHILDKKPNCECDEYLLRLGVKCDINKGGKVLRQKGLWLGYQSNTVAASKYCPFDYCVPTESFFSLSSPDEQCINDRSGVLCGECRRNLSLVLGTSNCKECSNLYLLLIIPFALAGVALVVFLLKCNLTVSVGHVNSLIFYANIVHVNKALLFQSERPGYRILTIFIAWLNLDLSIETCFFDGMDTYSKVWLQFVFPVYLWVMVGLIVILAHYFSQAGRLIGSNSVPVLATLFILSYAKLLRTIIAAVSFTLIEFEDSSPENTVWLWDANVEYFSPKHSALFFVAILFTFGYIVPLTLLFFFSPCLQSKSHKKVFRWVNKLKPFLDANQGPYSNKFRWWGGLLLIVRIILFSIYASNFNNDAATSFFWTAIIVGPLSIFCLTKQNVYQYKSARISFSSECCCALLSKLAVCN